MYKRLKSIVIRIIKNGPIGTMENKATFRGERPIHINSIGMWQSCCYKLYKNLSFYICLFW